MSHELMTLNFCAKNTVNDLRENSEKSNIFKIAWSLSSSLLYFVTLLHYILDLSIFDWFSNVFVIMKKACYIYQLFPIENDHQ